MNRRLRKRHLQVWIAWAILLPAGIAIAYASIQNPVTDKLLQPATTAALSTIIKHTDKENYTVALRTDKMHTSFQFQWVNKSALTFPTATIYTVQHGNDISRGKLIGRIEARGNYYFAVDSSFATTTTRLLVYDFIHQQIIDSVKL